MITAMRMSPTTMGKVLRMVVMPVRAQVLKSLLLPMQKFSPEKTPSVPEKQAAALHATVDVPVYAGRERALRPYAR